MYPDVLVVVAVLYKKWQALQYGDMSCSGLLIESHALYVHVLSISGSINIHPPPFITWFFKTTRVSVPNSILIRFARLTSVSPA